MSSKLLLAAFLCAALSAQAHAEDAIVEGPGYKVGDGTVLHPSVGVETGFDSNVFYEEDDPVASPILRLVARFAMASLSEQRLEEETLDTSGLPPGEAAKVAFRAGLSLGYQEYLTGNDRAQSQRDLAIGAELHALIFPKGTVAFSIDNNFVRDTRPTNFESSEGLDRDVNHLKLAMIYQPGGRALTGAVRYENRIDVFESDQSSFANRLQHTIGARVDWQFLPITRFYFDASLGFFGPLGDGMLEGTVYKQESMPLRLVLGANTAITERTTLATRVGFGKGFYEDGADFTGPIFGAQFGYRYSPFGRFVLQYDYDFHDSINANYFADHALTATVDHQVSQFLFRVGGGARYRAYRGIPASVGPPERDDVIFNVLAQSRYMYRDWLAVTADYDLVVDETDYIATAGGFMDNPSYTRHQALLGVQAAF